MTQNRPAKITLVLADVDGTLVSREKLLTPRAQDAVRNLTAQGIKFAITSGRPPRGMAMLIAPLALTTPIAGFNGGQFAMPDLSIIESHTLSGETARRAVEVIGQHDMDLWVYNGQDWLVHDPAAPHAAREEWTVKFAPKVTKDFAAALDGAVKLVGVSDDAAKMARCEKAVQSALGEQASAALSQPYYLDVTHREANKGSVVTYLANRFGIPAMEILTIGDMPNDVLMFRKSGFSIAMGNASAEVQAQADAVTEDCDNDGFAKAMETYILA